jgi:hypothetical protein
VWGSLVAANRAVGEFMDNVEKRRKRMALSELFVALLLDGFDRHLTLKDVLSSFYKDPRFPLVPTLDEIRQVIYNLLQPVDHAGPGTGGWELVGSHGIPLHVEGPKQLAISSIQQQLRRAQPQEIGRVEESCAGADLGEFERTRTMAVGSGEGNVASASASVTSRGKDKKSDSYSWYRVEVTNRSIVDEAKRDAIRAHLVWLASKLDDGMLDHQLITLKYELMAGSDAGLAEDVKTRAKAIQANKADVEEEI